jgi:hypothetical protein
MNGERREREWKSVFLLPQDLYEQTEEKYENPQKSYWVSPKYKPDES